MTTKTRLLTLVTALLIPFGALANDIGGTAADPDDNQENQDVHLTTAAIVIDGDLSDWSFNNPITDPLIGIPKIGRDDRLEDEEPTEFVVHEALSGTWTGPEDQSSTMEIVWKNGSENPDEDGVYMGLVVTDDYHENIANSGWNGDSVQMMVTFYESDFEEHDPSDFALYNFALGGVDGELDPDDPIIVRDIEKEFAFFSGLADEFVEVGITRDTDAQQTFYEIFLGQDALGLDDYEEGAQFGIGMAINDGDEEVNGQGGWVGLGAHAIVFGKTPAEAALLTLAPEAVVVEPTCDSNTGGDFDGNGKVEFADFLILSGNFGNDVDGHAAGDADCNGKVEFADFLVLSGNFGSTVGEAQSVPEPSSLGLGLLGFSALALGSVRRRRSG